MENKKLKNLNQLLVKLDTKAIRDQMVEINEKLQNLFEKYNILNDD